MEHCMRPLRFECGRCITCEGRVTMGLGPRTGRLRWLAGWPLRAIHVGWLTFLAYFENLGHRWRARARKRNAKPCLCCGGRGIYVVKVSTGSLSGDGYQWRELEDWSCWAHMDEVGATLKEQLHEPPAVTWTGAA